MEQYFKALRIHRGLYVLFAMHNVQRKAIITLPLCTIIILHNEPKCTTHGIYYYAALKCFDNMYLPHGSSSMYLAKLHKYVNAVIDSTIENLTNIKFIRKLSCQINNEILLNHINPIVH
jgi:hypothetical protein